MECVNCGRSVTGPGAYCPRCQPSGFIPPVAAPRRTLAPTRRLEPPPPPIPHRQCSECGGVKPIGQFASPWQQPGVARCSECKVKRLNAMKAARAKQSAGRHRTQSKRPARRLVDSGRRSAKQNERLNRLLLYLEEQEAHPPEYFTPTQFAGAMECDNRIAGLILKGLLPVENVRRKGYSSKAIYDALRELSETMGPGGAV